jgi:hypothetical protein
MNFVSHRVIRNLGQPQDLAVQLSFVFAQAGYTFLFFNHFSLSFLFSYLQSSTFFPKLIQQKIPRLFLSFSHIT